MPGHVVALHEHIGRPAHEVRLALDDVGDHAFLEGFGGGFVAGAGGDAALVAQGAGGAVHEHGGGAVLQVLDERGVRVRNGYADARRLGRAAAHVGKGAGALALRGGLAGDGSVVGVDLEHGRCVVRCVRGRCVRMRRRAGGQGR